MESVLSFAIILTLSTLLSVMCLPTFKNEVSTCPNNRPHVFIKTSNGVKCNICRMCPHGKGLSISCEGQLIPKQASMHCLDCIDGTNYSSEYNSEPCQPCRKCENMDGVLGTCVKTADNQKCINCKKEEYFNHSSQNCGPCTQLCNYDDKSGRETCLKKGFDLDEACPKPSVEMTTIATTTIATTMMNKQNVKSNEKKKIIVAVLLPIFCIAAFFMCSMWGKRIKKLKVDQGRWPVGKEWLKLCFHHIKSTDHHSQTPDDAERVQFFRPATAVTGNERNEDQNNPERVQFLEPATAVTGNEGNEDQNNPDHMLDIAEGRPSLERQHSTPVTMNERNRVQIPSCRHKTTKPGQLRSEFYTEMCCELDVADHELSYKGLAGKMGLTVHQVSKLTNTDSLLKKFFAQLGNDMEKLMKHLNAMGRSQMADDLKEELACECPLHTYHN